LKLNLCLFKISQKLRNRVRSKDVRHRGNLIQCPWMWVMIFTDDRYGKLGPARRFGWVGVLVECANPFTHPTTGHRAQTRPATADHPKPQLIGPLASLLVADNITSRTLVSFRDRSRRRNMCFSALSIDQLLFIPS